MEKYVTTGKFINTRMTKSSVINPVIEYAGYFEQEGGITVWVNLTKEQYMKVKCGKRLTLEYCMNLLPDGRYEATAIDFSYIKKGD